MSDFHGHSIDLPGPITPASVIDGGQKKINNAKEGWKGLVVDMSLGYSQAWDRQMKLLGDIKSEIQTDRDRQVFVLSIYTAGIAGGLLGGLMGGAFQTADHITQALQEELSLAEKVAATQASNAMDVTSRMSDDAASQFGGTILSYMQSTFQSGTFEPPGIHPWGFYLTMQHNLDVFFGRLLETFNRIVESMKSGKLKDLENAASYFTNLSFVKTFPDSTDFGKSYTNEASLCLWIAWGAERNVRYWTKAWQYAEKGLINTPPGIMEGIVRGLLKLMPDEYMDTVNYYNDIVRWDVILNEIRTISPALVPFVERSAPGVQIGEHIQYAGMHLDILKLKDLGINSGLENARAMSQYFSGNMPMEPEAARQVLAGFGAGLFDNTGRNILSQHPFNIEIGDPVLSPHQRHTSGRFGIEIGDPVFGPPRSR